MEQGFDSGYRGQRRNDFGKRNDRWRSCARCRWRREHARTAYLASCHVPESDLFGYYGTLCRQLCIHGISDRRCRFQNLIIEEGWDGIHIRGGKNTVIRNCELYTGDDAIAGGYWENVAITDCRINSACNGIRLIMPATGLKITHCTFKGPGVYPHRTSKELKRRYMLSAVLLQPGGWGPAPGYLNDVYISDLDIENMENPFMFILNIGNESNRILVERVKARKIFKSAASIESWKGGSFQSIVLRNIDIEFDGHNDSALKI